MEKLTNNTTKNDDLSKQYHSISSHKIITTKRSFISSCFCLPITSFLALFILVLLAYNSFTIFFYFTPSFSLENPKQTQGKKFQNSQFPSSTPIYAMKAEQPRKTHHTFSPSTTYFTQAKSPRNRKAKMVPKTAPSSQQAQPRGFSKQVKQFFVENSCKVRVFMTWISSLDSFGDRERFCIESLFKFHPNACLLIVSDSMDTYGGSQILRPFRRMNFKIMAIAPDFRFIFKDTMGGDWYNELEKGNVRKGDISIGQNLSNLLRLALLYKYGGIYIDTDFVVLRRLNKLRNSIGAQMVDPRTGKWSRLNNALLIFDKKHPLLNKFIEEFALTFNGNKWGHNGPYLVSRVVERLNGTMGLEGQKNFTILPPPAFYIVDWVRIGSLFHEPKDERHLQWINDKLKQIEGESYALHLWNRQSRGMKVENGSIISHLMKKSCVVCNSTSTL